MVTDPIKAAERLEALSRKYEQYGAYVQFLAQCAKQYGLWEQYGKKLSDLYLRLKQGPVRMVIAGESSTGKSTLINAFAGEFIVPESAGVCTPVPVWLQWHGKNSVYVNPYRRYADKLPEAQFAMSPSRLLELQYSAKADETFQSEQQILVYVNSPYLPRHTTLVDTPGLNANDADTAKTYALFDPPAYCGEGESDAPEILLFLTRHENLMQSEVNALKDLFARGADRQSCFLVHNDVRARSALFADTFEDVNRQAVAGLRSSLASLEETAVAEEDCYSADLSFLDEDLAMEHVYSLNALLARLQCVDSNEGVYPMAQYLTAEVTLQQRDELLQQEEKQRSIAAIRDEWAAMGNKGYAPMQALVEGLREHVLWLAENSPALEEALTCAEKLGQELLSRCKPPKEDGESRKKLRALLRDLDQAQGGVVLEKENVEKTITVTAAIAAQMYAVRNEQVDLVIKKTEGKKINWGIVLATVAGSLVLAQPWLLFTNIMQFLKSDAIWDEFKRLTEEHVTDEQLKAMCTKPDAASVQLLVPVVDGLLRKLETHVTVEAEPFRAAMEKGLAEIGSEVQRIHQVCRTVEKSFAAENGVANVRRMLCDGFCSDLPTLMDRLMRLLRKRIKPVGGACTAEERQLLAEVLRLNGGKVLESFGEKKQLLRLVVSPVLKVRLDGIKIPLPQDLPEIGKLITEYIASADKLRRTLRSEIQEAILRRQQLEEQDYAAKAKALAGRLQEEAQQLLEGAQ